MFTRKLCGLVAGVVILGLASVAWAADTTYVAQLTAQRGDQLATGRAMWMAQGGMVTFSVFVENVRSADFVTVTVDGRVVGTFEIIDGSGFLVIRNQQEVNQVPPVFAGSLIVIFAEDTDRPILYGAFRTK
jgi:hypothetical protein